MKKAFKPSLMLFLALIMSSCENPLINKEVSVGDNFRPGFEAPSSTPTPTPDPQEPVGAATGFKVTSGATRSIGTDLSVKAAISLNDRKLTGSQVSGQFSINKSQVR